MTTPKKPKGMQGSGELPAALVLDKIFDYGYGEVMRAKWKSLARCLEGMLSNLAVIGIGLGLFEQKWWPATVIGALAAVIAIYIAWQVNHD